MCFKKMEIRGTAHPAPPQSGRKNPADLTGAEITATNISGAPLLDEHDANARVGTCLASWKGTDGSLRIAARVEDAAMAEKVRSGSMRGLSLGTDMVLGEGGNVLYRTQKELSVCEEGKRDGTWISHIDGRAVHATACASKRAGAAKPDNQIIALPTVNPPETDG